jgi:hypothetical protein
MRKFTLLAAAMIVAAVAAVPAFAATTKSTVTGKITPTKGGTAKKPVGHTIFTEVATTNDDGSQPPPVQRTILTYSKEFTFNGKAMAAAKLICSKNLLDAQGPTACPKGSQVGTGSSDALIGGDPNTPPALQKNIKVTAFNGPGGDKLELYVGAPLQKTIEGKLTGRKGKPQTLTFDVPDEAINPAGAVISSITRFGATIKASVKIKRKTVNYVTTTGCPKNKILPLKATFIYATKKDFPSLADFLVSAKPKEDATYKMKCS